MSNLQGIYIRTPHPDRFVDVAVLDECSEKAGREDYFGA